jgi:hypothetical protein
MFRVSSHRSFALLAMLLGAAGLEGTATPALCAALIIGGGTLFSWPFLRWFFSK